LKLLHLLLLLHLLILELLLEFLSLPLHSLLLPRFLLALLSCFLLLTSFLLLHLLLQHVLKLLLLVLLAFLLVFVKGTKALVEGRLLRRLEGVVRVWVGVAYLGFHNRLGWGLLGKVRVIECLLPVVLLLHRWDIIHHGRLLHEIRGRCSSILLLAHHHLR
jgi:hypothetical protein